MTPIGPADRTTIRPVTFRTPDGLSLEGRVEIPPSPVGAAVICHPYPPAGGSMSNSLIPALQRALGRVGWAALRFNFRGVGRSEGAFSNGRDEVQDVRAALAFVRSQVPSVPSAVVGWSFGALMGLIEATSDPQVSAYVGIAPPISVGAELDLPPLPEAQAPPGWQARALLICGSADTFCSANDLRRLAGRLAAEIRIIEGADHFFDRYLAELASAVSDFLDSRD